jgi:integrase
VDYGVRDGKRRRHYVLSLEKAKAALARGKRDADALGRRWAEIEPAKRRDLVELLDEVNAAGLTLREVWTAYRKGAHIAPTGRITLRETIEKMLASKLANGRDQEYVKNMRQALDKFAAGQGERSLVTITGDEVENYIRSVADTPGYKISLINRFSTLFAFAIMKGWLENNPCDRIERPKLVYEVEVLSNAEVVKLLSAARAKHAAFLQWYVLGLFCGLRPEEADAATWDNINLEAKTIFVPATTSKTRKARTVHLEPTAVAWLKLGGELPMAKSSRRKEMRAVREVMGWEVWPKDCLRHTCASHWIALKKSFGAVALEMGNSESVLKRHYRKEVSPADCAEFWALTPQVVAKKAK